MGQCCSCKKKSKFASYKKELGAPLLRKLKDDLDQDSRVIIVKLISASGIAGADSFSGTSDPYIELTLKPGDPIAGEQHQRSTAKARTLEPKWDPPERFQFIVSNLENSRIVLSCYHRYSEKDTKVLGDSILPTKEVGTSSVMKKLKLINPDNGKFQGEIEVEVVQMSVQRASSIEEHRVYEFQRWQPVVLWGNDYPGHLLPSDPGRWSTADGKKFSTSFEEVEPKLPPGWVVVSPWSNMATGEQSGWQYSMDFASPAWRDEQGMGMYVRRRLWTREVANELLEEQLPASLVLD